VAYCFILLASASQLLLRRDSSVQALQWTVWYPKVCGRSMVTEIPGGCDRLEDMYEFGCGVYSAAFRMVHLIAKVQRDPFISARKPKVAIIFPGHKCAVNSRLMEAGFRVCCTELKDLFTGEHELYHPAPAESKVNHLWDRFIFSDESTFNTANGPVLVYRPWGHH